MTPFSETTFSKDSNSKKIRVSRTFDAPVAEVWRAWTDASVLDQWWAPLPYKAVTDRMEFREGGTWLYYMLGPDGSKTWCRADYEKIETEKSFTGLDAFCDEAGVISPSEPRMHWLVQFHAQGQQTRVDVEITFPTAGDMERIIEMGFQEGFTAAHGNLDRLLAA